MKQIFTILDNRSRLSNRWFKGAKKDLKMFVLSQANLYNYSIYRLEVNNFKKLNTTYNSGWTEERR